MILSYFRSLIISVLVFTTIGFSAAQTSGAITLDPQYPEPKSPVTLTFESNAFDVNIATITWKVGQKIVLSGQGESALKLTTGGVGESTVVSVRAELTNGEMIEQQITVTPSSVVLLYEAPASYVPLLYEGRSLPADGGLVSVSAFPQMSENGVTVSPQTMSYTWYLDDAVIRSQSGVGKQSAQFNLNYLSSETVIKVLIRTPSGNTTSKEISIRPHAVMPVFYKYDEIFGPDFTKALERRTEETKDFILNLVPFYVSTDGSAGPSINWYMDNSPATPLGGTKLALHPKDNSYGSKMLTVLVSNKDKIMQKAEVSLELIFDTRK